MADFVVLSTNGIVPNLPLQEWQNGRLTRLARFGKVGGMTGAEVIQRLQATRDRKAIASGADVPYSTVSKIAAGQTKNPRTENIDKLRAYFQRQDARPQ